MMRSTIKLLGTAMVSGDDGKLSVFVSPVLVPLEHPIASTRGAGNIVSVDSKVLYTHLKWVGWGGVGWGGVGWGGVGWAWFLAISCYAVLCCTVARWE